MPAPQGRWEGAAAATAMAPDAQQIRKQLSLQPPSAASSGPRKAPLQEVVVAGIAARHGQAALGVLQTQTDYAGLAHLKRIRKAGGGRLEVLLATAGDWPHLESGVRTALDAAGIELSTSRCQVPAAPPESVAESRAWAAHWPPNYRRPRRPPPALGDDEAVAMHGFCLAAAEVARGVEAPHEAVAAMLVHPESGKVVASAVDTSGRRGGGAAAQRVEHAIINCIRAMAAPHKLRGEEQGRQYLCTGLDMYTTREPCVMCAMALVHARIRRLIYVGTGNATRGIASGVHQEAALNHRYYAYCMCLG